MTTAKKSASMASRILKESSSSKMMKSVAGSDLSQSKGKQLSHALKSASAKTGVMNPRAKK